MSSLDQDTVATDLADLESVRKEREKSENRSVLFILQKALTSLLTEKPKRLAEGLKRWSAKLVFEVSASPLNQISLFLGLVGVVGFGDDIWHYIITHTLTVIIGIIVAIIVFLLGWYIQLIQIERRRQEALNAETGVPKEDMIMFLEKIEALGAGMSLTQNRLKTAVGMEGQPETFLSVLADAEYLNLLRDDLGVYVIPDIYKLRRHLQELKDG